AGVTGRYTLTNGSIAMNLSNNSVSSAFLNLNGNAVSFQNNNNCRIWQADLFENKVISRILEINSGLNYRTSNSNQFSFFPAFQTAPSIIPSSQKVNISSVFTSLFFKNLGGFHLELGGRYNDHSTYGDNFTYTINPSYIFANKYKFFANVSSAFKAPTLYQLFSQYGNLDLKPEVTQTYDAGFDFDLFAGKLNVNATAFQRITNNNAIYFYSEPVTFKSYYRNGRKQNDKGFELETILKPIQSLSLNAFYSYVEGELTIDENTKQSDLYRRPKNQFGGTISYQPVQKITVGVTAKYTGKRKEQDFRTFPAIIVTNKSYTLVDTYVEASPLKTLTIFADMKNIFNEKYVEWLGYNTRGFNFNAGLKYNIK
ncbi:MAG: TonB-dependent receptor, partial [Pyrinomonadaceae bacterium]|nr:TonB-dependent receptor [Sphingobacteriaceae bacterium]